MPRPRSISSIDSKLLARVRGKGARSVFLPSDFRDLGSYDAVIQALHRHAKAGNIRKVGRGVYELTERLELVGEVGASYEDVAHAIAGRDATKLHPTGAYAANVLGLSEQVPMRIAFLTSGRPRKLDVRGVPVELRHSSARYMDTSTPLAGLLIQALRYIGKRHFSENDYRKLAQRIPAKDRKALMKDLHRAPAWIAEIMKRLAAEPN